MLNTQKYTSAKMNGQSTVGILGSFVCASVSSTCGDISSPNGHLREKRKWIQDKTVIIVRKVGGETLALV